MELIVRQGEEEHRLRVERRERSYELRLGERTFVVDSVAANGSVRSLLVEGRQYEVAVTGLGDGRYQVSSGGTVEEVEVLDPLTHLAEQGGGSGATHGAHRVSAYMPGRVVTVLVAEGDEVTAGQGLVVLEAMKMENEIQAELPGVVRRVYVAAGQAVEGGDPLFEIE